EAGADGTRTTAAAEGGAAATSSSSATWGKITAGPGAAGAANTGSGASAPESTVSEPADLSTCSTYGGGGGGGLGRIVIRTVSGEAEMDDATFSPSGDELLTLGKAKTFTLE
ncbi:MAG: hypothetical protein KC417_11990, partial [Myxococcales bacterium]|nr:hypothetical protein [Myxococcales bacterium]